jgi:hypothetical protein
MINLANVLDDAAILSLTALSASVRDFGQQHGIPELSSPEVPFDALPESPSEPAQVAWIMTEAAKVIGGSWTSYTGDVGGGTRAAFLVEHPDFQLPAPQPARTMRVLQQALAELPLTDARRALRSYATRRGLASTFSPDNTHLRLTAPGFEATIDFDEHNRVAGINASMSSPA